MELMGPQALLVQQEQMELTE
jgi:hypothetical protein